MASEADIAKSSAKAEPRHPVGLDLHYEIEQFLYHEVTLKYVGRAQIDGP